MKVQAQALAAALFSAAALYPTAFAFTTNTAFTTTRNNAVKNNNAHYDTSLFNGMDAYDAQMRAMAAAANAAPPAAAANANANAASAGTDKMAQRWRKKTKQLATLGPASCDFEMIEKLFLAGADVFRLNFSHGEHDQKKELLDIIRAVEQKHDHPIAILGDLQGPKLRVGQFSNPDGEYLAKGQIFRFDLDEYNLGTHERVMLPHPEIIEASEVGHYLLIDDGKVKVRVVAKGPGYLDTEVEVPGKIKDKKGVNTPDSILQISCLTPKDRADLTYMLSIGVDWIALSFVQRPEDIVEIQRLIAEQNPSVHRPHVMAKIEKPSCFDGDSLAQIVELCDGIMVARGDLGVECAPEDVPILQKQIIDECREQGKPVVVATQMLESMIESPTPTRAEASDVATAIYDGADAIMLSAESAAGEFPEESVQMQQRIINRVEGDPHYDRYLQSFEPHQEHTSASAIIVAARQIARTVNAKAIVNFTVGGTTALKASQSRPGVPILAISPVLETARQLSLSWGIYSEFATDHVDYDPENFRDMLRACCEIANEKGLVDDPNDLLVVTAGFPFGTPGASNIIRVIPGAGPSYWDASL